ncbi:peptidoglycan-binding protein [Tepidanaerobacter sp. GT38]|uniref:L,D-transpeptidase family protein n=1 Tax=Tepidanaerobacter sp. GT38 TaxID=2722793 RepID=UPI001F213F26|nr:peptidoglycan-binding protein [Tepidanaerobacter sp. GT38]MCG1013331.1 peptidoglycan-binding protein [Tepidanaerobacter sp. GT38]
MKVKSFLWFIIATLIFITGAKTPPCSCEEERYLKLQNPPMYGEDVREIQTQLYKLGYSIDSINGIYDEATANAVREFQKREGLYVDGIFGPKTFQKLAELYEQPAARIDSEKPKGEVSLVILTLDRELIVLDDGKPFKRYPVAVGKFSTPTPIGLFTITQKDAWGEGFGSRWMRLSVPWGIYGIHGTNKPWSIGAFESGGCIRMHNAHVEQVYEWVKIGTKVFIVGGVDGPFTFGFNTLTQGSKGSDVLEVQKRLAGYGFYDGPLDGIYEYKTRQAVIEFQKSRGLNPSGNVDAETYEALGIMLFE